MFDITDPSTKFNKTYMFIGNGITIITGLTAFISWFIKELSKITNKIPDNIVYVLSHVFNFCITIFIIALIYLFIRIIYVAIRTKSEAFYIQRKLSEFIHINLIHSIRNNIVELEPVLERLERYNKSNNTEAIDECYKSEVKILQNNLKTYVDALSSYLSQYRNSTISVCVKIFKKRDRNRNDFLSEEIISLARSSNTENDRANCEKTIIGQNTDFTNLCKGQIIFFASSNLYKNKESGQYINDSKNWKENKYKSTLVTPIQYHNNNNSNDEHNKNIKSDVIGFLCIDSQDEIKEWENSDSFELQFMAMFSDILYVYIKEFYKCFENVGYNIN